MSVRDFAHTANWSEEQLDRLQNVYDETLEFERRIGLIIPTIFAVVIGVGLLGNCLVVIVVALNRQMRNSTNTLIVGLAASDILFLTFCVPFTAADYMLPTWDFPHWCCTVMMYLQFVSAYASVWTLVLMSLDRFLAVCYPIQSLTLRSMRNTAVLVGISWAVILAACAPVTRTAGIHEYHFIKEERSTCTYVGLASSNATRHQVRGYFFSFNLAGYLLPLSITCILYYYMLRRLWLSTKPGSRFNTANKGQRAETVRAKRKVTWMVMSVIVAFAACWLPLNICFFLTALIYPMNLVALGGTPMLVFQIFSQVLAYTNSCLNPILYAFLSDNFRKGFARVFSHVCCCVAPFGARLRALTIGRHASSALVEYTHAASGEPASSRGSARRRPRAGTENWHTSSPAMTHKVSNARPCSEQSLMVSPRASPDGKLSVPTSTSLRSRSRAPTKKRWRRHGRSAGGALASMLRLGGRVELANNDSAHSAPATPPVLGKNGTGETAI